MHTGFRAGRLSTTRDEHVGRSSTMTAEKLCDHLMADCASPEHLDAVAFQLLCNQRRCRTAGHPDYAKQWKAQRLRAEAEAAAARARLAAAPSLGTHPGFFAVRGATPPGHLYHEVRLAHAFVLDLGRDRMATGVYSPDLVDGMTYRTGGCRDMKVWIAPASGHDAFPLELALYKGLAGLGRVRAVPLSAFQAARNAATTLAA